MEENSRHDNPLGSLLEAVQRSAGEVSTSFQSSAGTFLQNAGNVFATIHRNMDHLQPSSHAPFAATSSPLERRKGRGGKSDSKHQGRGVSDASTAAKPSQPSAATSRAAVESAAPVERQKAESILPQLDKVGEPPSRTALTATMQWLHKYRRRLNKEDRDALDAEAARMIGKMVKVMDPEDGVDYTLGELAQLAKEEKAFKDMGAEEPAIRKKLRKEVMDEIPSWRLRQDAPKMQLRPWEHEALPLDRFGEGHLFTLRKVLGLPYGVHHDFSWGMFGRIGRAREFLSKKWAGRDPEQVLRQQEFYADILKNSAKMELTLMMVAERPMPIAQLRDKFLERQSIVMRQLKRREHLLEPRLKPEHLLLLARIKREFTPKSLKESGLIDAKGNVLPGSKLIVAMGPENQLTAEAITPGTLREQRTVPLGLWWDKKFARGVLEQFLGVIPVDPIGKHSVGNGVLYVTNGFNFKPPEQSNNPFQFYKDEEGTTGLPEPSILTLLKAGPQAFKFDEKTRPQRLVNNIHRIKLLTA